MSVRLEPTRGTERVLDIDVLRGFALLGILLVNMEGFAWPITESRLLWHESSHLADRLAGWLIRVLAQGKFFTMFSMLVGLGLAIIMERAEARGARFLPLYLRRLVVLLLFGLVHINLLWAGDVLTDYAILGAVLLLFRRCRPKVLVVWAAVIVAAVILIYTGATALVGAGTVGVGPEDPLGTAVARVIEVYRHGTFAEMRSQRLREIGELWPIGALLFDPVAFAMFLLGLAIGRAGAFRRIADHLAVIRRVCWWGLGLGLLCNLAGAIGDDVLASQGLGPMTLIAAAAQFLGYPLLMLGYASGVVLLLQRPAWRSGLAPLASVGRMPLTNYLMQSVICTTIFYGYGLGLFGRIGVAAGVGLAVAIYAAQVWLSGWWFRRFAFGPLEWVWRALSYGRVGPARGPQDSFLETPRVGS